MVSDDLIWASAKNLIAKGQNYEKKLPYGSVFSLSTHDNKKLNMSGRASVVIVVFIHKSITIIFTIEILNLK